MRGSNYRPTENAETTLGALGSKRRLHALSCLRDRGSPIALRELAEDVAAREFGAAPDRLPDHAIDHVHDALSREDVPKLQARDVVEYDPLADEIRLADDPGEIEAIVDAVFD